MQNLKVLYEDNHIIVVKKEPNIPSQADKTGDIDMLSIIKEYLKENLSEYKGDVKNVVLGCTHYPLIEKKIKEVLGDVEFFNGAASLSKHLKDILIEKNLINDKREEGIIEFVDSSNLIQKRERFYKYLKNN